MDPVKAKAGLHLAHQAMVLDDLSKLAEIGRKKYAQFPEVTPVSPPNDDDTGIHIGDRIEQPRQLPPGRSQLPLIVGASALGGAGLASLLAIFLAGGGQGKLPVSIPTSSPAPAAKERELEIRWRLGSDGKWQTQVEEVKP